MPQFDLDSPAKRGFALGVIVVAWLLCLTTAAFVLDYHAQGAGTHYQIPPILLELFSELCRGAIGLTLVGAGIGTAIHFTNRQIEAQKDQCPGHCKDPD